ncbi:hypothetical protein BDV96DRAFT_652455 [Lophiotrema nucula]|uniref:Uncharacterized protein n=1 Tax=Lophiotrema nucula TaxID=690887 RepID=A0A6A5YPG9_9PLEO|nr:hypothetical protein BDV96DRAFT_652455 [Lophiotrema nucula]
MGQSQSQPQRATTPEPDIDPAERARLQAEERARRAAAVEQRLAAQQKRDGRKTNGMKLRPSAESKAFDMSEQTSKDASKASTLGEPSTENQQPTTTTQQAPKSTLTPTPADVDETTTMMSGLNVDDKEDRARRAAAVAERLSAQQKRGNAGPGAASTGSGKKKLTPLEQLSKENKGWRDADEMADLRAWN